MGRYTWRTGVLEVGMVLVAALFAVPLWMLISTAFRTAPQISSSPMGVPTSLYLGNFSTAWAQGALGPAFLSSIIITLSSLALLVVIGATASYYFARSTSRLAKPSYLLIIAGIMVPAQVGVFPLYSLFKRVGLAGTQVSVIVFSVGVLLPLTVLLYTNFVRQLAVDFEEAAQLDGATSFQAFRHVVMPLLLPVTGTVIILDGVAIWNDFFTPLIYLGGTPRATLPVQIFSFVGEYSSNWGAIFAGLLLSSAPVLILYFGLQRYVIRGFSGGLRG